LSTVGVALTLTAAGSAETTYTLSETGLGNSETVAEYEESGTARVNVSTPRLTVTVAEQASACGLDTSVAKDTRNDYLCLDYREDVPATIRLHVPDDYWHPYVRQEKASLRGDTTASFTVRDDGNATVVETSFDTRTHAVFAIPEDVTASYYVLDRANTRSKDLFGIDLLGHSTGWQHVNDSLLSGSNTTARLVNEQGSLIIQYDATPNASEPTWLAVPSEPGDSAPVYRMTRSGEPDAVYIVSETTNAPRVRYKSVSGLSQRIDAAWRQIRSIDDELDNLIDNTIGRLFSTDGGSE
jgi:hypothetical protein